MGSRGITALEILLKNNTESKLSLINNAIQMPTETETITLIQW